MSNCNTVYIEIADDFLFGNILYYSEEDYTNNSYSISTLTPNTKYYIRTTSYNNDNNIGNVIDFSCITFGTIQLDTIDVESDVVTLNMSGLYTDYIIQYKNNNISTWDGAIEDISDVNTYKITNLDYGEIYNFRVFARNQNYLYSSIADITTTQTMPYLTSLDMGSGITYTYDDTTLTDYIIYQITFTDNTNNTITINSYSETSTQAYICIVGGGGGGGLTHNGLAGGGGGGAGEIKYGYINVNNDEIYTVSVGGGGAGGNRSDGSNTSEIKATDGSNTTISINGNSIIANGGGFGGSVLYNQPYPFNGDLRTGGIGGSSGGSAPNGDTINEVSTTDDSVGENTIDTVNITSLVNNSGKATANYKGSGGGGAGGAGGSVNGGIGYTWVVDGNQIGIYGGGGGGGGSGSSGNYIGGNSDSSGGSSGGGGLGGISSASGTTYNGSDGTANTGGGGGGGASMSPNSASQGSGGDGGSGIIVILFSKYS